MILAEGDYFVVDPNWLPEVVNTAPDPSYPGAHAVISAGGAAVLIAFFEEDDFLGRERLPEEVRDRRELAGRRRLRGRGQQHTG